MSGAVALLTCLCLSGVASDIDDGAHFAFRAWAMSILLGWSILNIIVGGIGARLSRPPRTRVFFGANAAWNLVNLAIAVGGLWSALEHAPGSLVGIPLLREVELLQKILLVNVGLDVGYVGTGIVTWLWGRDRGDIWRVPIGAALVVQGVFLLGFDVILAVNVGHQLDALWQLI